MSPHQFNLSYFKIIMVLSIIFVNTMPILTISNLDTDRPIHQIVISSDAGFDGDVKAFDKTVIYLETKTTYNITFHLGNTTFLHNLVIDMDNDVSLSTLNEPEDTIIGIHSNTIELEEKTDWSILWITPEEDVTIIYYCGFSGHYSQGMIGKFIVGDGSSSLVSGFTVTLLLVGLFISMLIIRRMYFRYFNNKEQHN